VLRRPFVIAILIALATGGTGLIYLYAFHRVSVSVAPVTRGPAVEAVYATGVVEPVRWAKVAPLVRGRIVELCTCEGRQVAAGDVLAKLDDTEARANLEQLQARERFLAEDVARYRTLRERGIASPQAFQRAVSEHLQVQAEIAAASERLGHYALRSPMDGVVLRRDGEVGEIAEVGQVLFSVGQPQPLWIVADVDEEDIPLVALHQRTMVKADAFPGRALDGHVAEITPQGDPVTKSYRVRVALPEDTLLLIGMTVEINVIVREVADALLVPTEALVDGDGAVWVVQDGRAHRRAIETGIIGDSRAQVAAGLEGHEVVIVNPSADLADGDRVRDPKRP